MLNKGLNTEFWIDFFSLTQRCGFGWQLNYHTSLVFVKKNKTVGNSAGDFYEGGERKTDILDSDGIKITNYPL